MVTESQVYRDLQKHLDKLPIGFPATQSGVEIRILKHLFAPEEAELATQLSMTPESLDNIHSRVAEKKEMSVSELERALGRMAYKGSITVGQKQGQAVYSLVPLAIGMYELQVNRLTEDFARDVNLYLHGEFGDEMYRTKIPQLRTVPVTKSIAGTQTYVVSSYDDIIKILADAGGRIAVMNCICRQNRNVIGEKCSKTDLHETCLLFRETADRAVKGKIGRPLSTEEALAILDQAQADGLVAQPENAQHPRYVCCCCGDCCGILTTVKRFSSPTEFYATNYYAQIDPALCVGCETCVEQCQLEAISMMNEAATVDIDRCIGCGNCVAICSSDASRLVKKEAETIPPEDTSGLYMKIMSKKVGK